MSINTQIAPKDEIFIWADQASDSESKDDYSASEDTINVKSVKMCKWGAKCKRKDCWFSHTSAKPAKKSKVRSFYPVRSIKKTIDYKMCRYRTDCKKQDCKWFHPSSERCAYETIQECIRENKKACNMRHLDETPRDIK